MPRSLWQCTLQTALSEFGILSRSLLDQLAELLRHRVADRVRDVDGGRALLDHRLQHAAEEVEVGARAVLGRELDVRAGVLREAHRELRLLEHLLGRHAQLLLHVQRAGGDEGVDAPGLRALQRVDAALDVAVVGAAQAGHDRVLDHLGDRAAPPRSRRWTRPGSRPRSRRPSCAPARARCAASRPRVIDAPGLCSPSRMVVSKMIKLSVRIEWSLGPFRPGHNTDCRQEFLARGAQQQAAQREEREREESGNRLLHDLDYTAPKMISRSSNLPARALRAPDAGGKADRLAAPGARRPSRLLERDFPGEFGARDAC